MFPFQLEIAGVLAASAAVSVITFWLFKKKTDRQIQLPLRDNEDQGHDPFDVTAPTDFVDGYPIQEPQFWKKMRWRKIVITFFLSFAVAVNAYRIGYVFINKSRNDMMDVVFQLVFALYLVIISAHSVTRNGSESHAASILHTTSLTTLASLLLATVAILPSTPPPDVQSSDEPSLHGIWYSLIFLYTVTCVLGITTPLGPPLHYPPEHIYSNKTVAAITNPSPANVCGIIGASIWGTLMFSYTTKVVWLGNVAESLDIGDLPILSKDMRATFNYARTRVGLRRFQLRILKWKPQRGSGWGLAYKLARLNVYALTAEAVLTAISACLSYAPVFFLRRLIAYLESDPKRDNPGWGWVYIFGLFMASSISYIVTDQMWDVATTGVEVRLRIQLNSSLFAKTLVRKDIASSASSSTPKDVIPPSGQKGKSDDEGDKISSKAQVMTLMTTDVDRVSAFAWHLFYLVNSPIDIAIGTVMLYNLLGVSCFFGLGVALLFQPLNHFAGKIFVGVEENLMKARDERTALMNEILGAIRMLKFMAWERSFEKQVLRIREKELNYQARHYRIEALWNVIWSGSPVLVTLIAFWHYAVVRQQPLTPSIAFTSIIVFSEMKDSLNALPETFINMLQCFVSLRRIEKYLNGAEVKPVPPLSEQPKDIAFQSCTVTWPQDRSQSSNTSSAAPSVVSTPRHKFVLVDLNIKFPRGELSLICGKLGSGKTLLLLALLGEADVLTGQVICPRSPPDSLAAQAKADIANEDWVVDGMCAYVPQAAWLRNATIKENILFSLPFNEERYRLTLEACALISDLEILEDGDESEIGERGVNLSGGQKARVSLARAIYSRASILFLDDVLSAVDAHTAHHLFHQCLKGELMQGRTAILVSHHIQLCSSGASYIVALDNGRVMYEGNREGFVSAGVIMELGQSQKEDLEEKQHLVEAEDAVLAHEDRSESSSTVVAPSMQPNKEKKPPRKLVEEETRAVGRIHKDIWLTFFKACGGYWYWILFALSFGVASIAPVLENGWLKYWSGAALEGEGESATFYIAVYALITTIGLFITTARWFVLYDGSIRASTVLYQRLLALVAGR
ncbi:hypothetical protein BKA70DRAFT_495907 [Coprinopsis sp. MPI-PUGE-AT-0042]|nr:hypothetical protein BKA70DRAFT_495907 [Coprinopsis sp. MPI-PUGE-AT-0042]